MSDNFERSLEQENERLALLVENFQLATGFERGGDPGGITPDVLRVEMDRLHRELDEARDQARVATRERDEARMERDEARFKWGVCESERDAARADLFKSETMQKVLGAERDATQDQCAMHQRAHNEAALMLERMRKSLGAFAEKQRDFAVNDWYAAVDLCEKYDASIRSDAPPPMDWEKRAKEAEADRDKAVAMMDTAQAHARVNVTARQYVEERLRLALAVVGAARVTLSHGPERVPASLGLIFALTAFDAGPTAPVVHLLQRLNAAESVVEAARLKSSPGSMLAAALDAYDAVKAPVARPALAPVAAECQRGRDVCPKCDGVKS